MVVNSPPIFQNSSLATSGASEPTDSNAPLNTGDRHLDAEVQRISHLERSLKQDIPEPSLENKKNLHASVDNLSAGIPPQQKNSGESKDKSAETFMDKALLVMTLGNVLANIPSILTSLRGLKKDGLEDKAAKLEKYGLYATKAQAVTAGVTFIEKGFKTKNIMLLLVGLAQAFKLPSGFNRLIRLSGIPSSLDQLPSAVNPLTGKDTYESFGESWKENTRVLSEVWNEFKNDPKSFLKFFKPDSPPDHTKALVPLTVTIMIGAILSNLVDFPIFGPLRQPLLAITAGMRHGGGSLSDYILSKDDKNPDNQKAGIIFLIGSALDYGAFFTKEKLSHVMHQAACLLNPIGEMFLIKGAARGHQEEHPADLVPQFA
jgi:hypothetical protein